MNMNLQVNLQVGSKIKIVTNESYKFGVTEEFKAVYTIVRNDKHYSYDLVDINNISFAGRFHTVNDIIPLLNKLLVLDSEWFLSYEVLENNNSISIPSPNKNIISFLKLIKSEHKWIAKDLNNEVGLYILKPHKETEWWTNDKDYINITSTFNLDFNFLSWDNLEPTLISDILLNLEEN